MLPSLIVYLVTFLIAQTTAATINDVSACSFKSIATESTGFRLKYYDYPYGDSNKFSQHAYQASGYTVSSLLGEATGVDVTYSSYYGINANDKATYNGMTYYSAHFAFEYTGFFQGMSLSFFGKNCIFFLIITNFQQL